MSRILRPTLEFAVRGIQSAAIALVVLTATGCSVQAPDETSQTDDVELALASEVEEERRAASSNSLIASANFNPATGQLIVAGQLPRAASVRIEDGSSSRLLGVVQAVSPFAVTTRGADDDDKRITAAGVAPWQFTLSQSQLAQLQLSTVPCTLRLQTPQGTVLIPVQSGVSPGQSLNCANDLTGQAQTQAVAPTITRATWNARTGSLIVAGSGAIPRQAVTFVDARTSQIIGLDEANATGAFRLRLTGVANPPCEIQVVTDSRTASSVVTGAPSACLSRGTAITGTNLAPNGVITAPSTDTIVLPGTTVNFDVVGIDPENNIPMTYQWNFDGASPNTNVRNPSVTFRNVGVYRVRVSVTDSLGATDLTPDVRTIFVQDKIVDPFADGPTNGQILSPAGNSTITAGQAIDFLATGSSQFGVGLTYFWNFGGGAANVSRQNTGPVVFNKVGIYTVTMTAVDALGNSDRTPNSLVVTVLAAPPEAPPVFDPIFAPDGEILSPTGNVTIAAGQGVAFTAQEIRGTSPSLAFKWDFGGGATNVSVQNPGPVVFAKPGVYTVTLTLVNSAGTNNRFPITRTVTVLASPPPISGDPFPPEGEIASPTGNVTITAGQSVAFTSQARDVSSARLTYTWDFGGGATNVSVQNPGPVVFAKPGVYTVTLTLVNSAGSVNRFPITRVITVVESPPVVVGDPFPPSGEILSPTGNVTITAGQSVAFTAQGSDWTGSLFYRWDFGGGATNVSVQNPGPVGFTKPGVYTVTLTLVNAFGTTNGIPIRRVITVVESPPLVIGDPFPPKGEILSPNGNVTITAGQSVTFSAWGSNFGVGSGLTYRWDFGGGATNVSVQNPGSVVFIKPGIYTVTLTVVNSNGIPDLFPATRVVAVVKPQRGNGDPFSPRGEILSPTSDVTMLAGRSVTFNAQGTDFTGLALTYMWDFGGGAANVSVQNPGPVHFNKPGIYTVTLTVVNSNGIPDLFPATRVITVVEPQNGSGDPFPPRGEILSPTSDVTLTLGHSVSFAARGTDITGLALTYLWEFCGGAANVSVQNPGPVVFTTAGIFTVTLTVVNSRGIPAWQVTRVITVIAPANGVAATGTDGFIVSPAANMIVTAGDTVHFMGSVASAVTTNDAFRYLWNFSGGAPNSVLLNPGDVVFNSSGTFQVSFVVINADGVQVSTPALRTITVNPR